MYKIGIGRLGEADGPEEYSVKMLIRAFGWSADEELPMNQEEESSTNSTKILMIRL